MGVDWYWIIKVFWVLEEIDLFSNVWFDYSFYLVIVEVFYNLILVYVLNSLKNMMLMIV